MTEHEDEALKKLLLEHIEALERVVGALAKQQRSPWQFRFGDITSAIAVIGLVLSIGQSWAVTGKRLDDVEKARAADALALGKVPQLEWTTRQISTTLEKLERQGTDQAEKLQEMRDALIKLGMQLPDNGRRK